MTDDGASTCARMPQELFEAIMYEFRRLHGCEDPLEDKNGYDAEYVRRIALFGAFVSVLGPSDGACILGMRRLREARE